MYSEKTKIRNIILIFLCVLFACILIYLIYSDTKEQAAQTAKNESLMSEAMDYESEIYKLKNELTSLKSDISYAGTEAKIIIGFIISGLSDIDYIEEKAENYNFSPVYIIDCMMDMSEIEEIIESTDESREIMLYCSDFSEDTNERVLSAIDYLESIERSHTGIFLLRYPLDTESNIQLVLDDGFKGYTVYNLESPKSGQLEDGCVYFDYSYLSTSGTPIPNRIDSLYKNKTALIVCFSMESINAGELGEDYVEALMDFISQYAEYEDFSFSTTAAVVEELSQINDIEKEREAAYEEQAEEINSRIAELEQIIHEIYRDAS